MPIWLRRLTFSKIQSHYDKEHGGGDVVEKSQQAMKSAGSTSSNQKINVPSYVVKASKK